MRALADDDVPKRPAALPRQRSPLLRGLRTLELLKETPSTVSEVARMLDVNRSSAQRLLQELEGANYVMRDRATRRYSATHDPRAPAAVGSADGTSTGPVEGELEVLHHELSVIRDQAGESTVFAMPASDRMLYAAFYPTGHPVGVRESIGSARPMHASAVGKAYLSALDSPTLDVVLGRLNYSEGTDRAAKGPIQLRDRLRVVSERGYAVDCDETYVGGSCVAIPVFVNGAVLIGAAGITGPTHRIISRLEDFGKMLASRVQNIVAT